MTTTRWLRASAVISLLFAVAHTLGGRKYWSPMGENAVLNAMRDSQFHIEGVDRCYLDFYLGFGYSISVFQALLAVLLWQLGTLARSNPKAAAPMIIAIALATALCGGISYIFILPLPALFSMVLLASLAVAALLARGARAIPASQP